MTPARHDLAGLKRKLAELHTLYEISQAIASLQDLQSTLTVILEILHKWMQMERGTLTLLNTRTNELSIEVAHGLSPAEIARGRYKLGEGITGKVVATGTPIVVPNVEKEPLFLDRTQARRDIKKRHISFICMPIKLNTQTIGALSVDRLFKESVSFEEDLRLLTIISSMVAQAVQIHQMVEQEKAKLVNENIILRRELKRIYRPENIVGESKKMLEVYSLIERVAPTRATVLLRGESGTGKELVARAIHYSSPRADKPFIKVTCAAVPENLLESELFGYEKGAFTGAQAMKKGRFELAHAGTLFLDEIGDISPATQVKLLRILQEREFERVGGLDTIKIDARLVAATNKDLEKAVKEGHFREDLYYRLNVVPVFIAPLRDRKEDIALLIEHFLAKFNKENDKQIKGLSDAAWRYFMEYDWPGNVRELENIVERAVIMTHKQVIDVENLPLSTQHMHSAVMPAHQQSNASAAELPAAVEALERSMIQSALTKTHRNRRKAAELLGITERILSYKLRRYHDLLSSSNDV